MIRNITIWAMRTTASGYAESRVLRAIPHPSLRNVATRKVFFHNGELHDLRQVLEFYASRDTQPEKWYSVPANGQPSVFDDLPVSYHANINREAPFGGKKGGKPALSESEISDMLAFLSTLSDADARPAKTAR
jgi:cytochrome c peroxidase